MKMDINMLSQYGMTESEIHFTLGSYEPEAVKANHFFLREGMVSNKIAFIVSGLLRSCFYDGDGNEITSRFFEQGSLIISLESFNNRTPSKENIVAVIDSDLMTITYEKQKALYENIPAWNQVCKDLADRASDEMISRALQFQTLTAKQRYEKLCSEHTDIIKHTPLRHIASYIGIDNATLSRIRRKK